MTLHLSHVLEECRPRTTIMTGICAGDAGHVQLGDLVVADHTFTYDNGKFTLDGEGKKVHLHDTLTYQLDANILQFLGLFDDWKPLVADLERPPSSLEQRETTCHIKAMASGSAVRADNPFEDVQAPVRGTVAIDKEGAAFGLVMSRHWLVPWLVVKGVCDYADQDKNDTYHDYAARASAIYALSFIRVYVTNERLPRPDEPSPSTGTLSMGIDIPPSPSNTPFNGSYPRIQDEQPIGTLRYTLNNHTGKVYSLAWSPDGHYLASAGASKVVSIVEHATQSEFQLPLEHTKTIFSLAWSPDGAFLGSGGQDGFIHIWDVVARRKLLTYHGHRDPYRWRATLIGQSQVFSLSWSPDGRLIASGGDDSIAQVWEALSGKTCYRYRGHAAGQDEAGFHAAVAISSVVWSPDGSRLATASCKISDKLEQDLFFNAVRAVPRISDFVAWNQYAKIHIWDALTGERVLIYPHHKIGVTALAWSPDGTCIASASKDKTVHVWKPTALCSPTRFTQNAFGGHTDQVKAVVWSPDGTYIASAGKDSTVQVWKISTGEHIYTYQGHTKCVRALAWSPDGNSLASAGDEKTIHIWKAP